MPVTGKLWVIGWIIKVWTGLLLRIKNEDQLAAVLSHEIAHYIKRHTLDQYINIQQQFGSIKMIAVIAGLIVGVTTGDVVTPRDDLINTTGGELINQTTATPASVVSEAVFYPGSVASILTYSRDQEREADVTSLKLMRDAGYDPLEAVNFWRRYINERKDNQEEVDHLDPFRSHHPTAEERVRTLEREAKCLIRDGPKIRTDRDQFMKTVLPHRREFLRDELDSNPFPKTEKLLYMLLQDGENSSEIFFYHGELWRRRGQSTDLEAALMAYKKAKESGTPPPELFRSMGEVLMKTGDLLGAKQAFQQYLKLNPDAQDRKMIEQMLKMIE